MDAIGLDRDHLTPEDLVGDLRLTPGDLALDPFHPEELAPDHLLHADTHPEDPHRLMTKTITLTLLQQSLRPPAKSNGAGITMKRDSVSKATNANLIMAMTQWFWKTLITPAPLTCQAVW